MREQKGQKKQKKQKLVDFTSAVVKVKKKQFNNEGPNKKSKLMEDCIIVEQDFTIKVEAVGSFTLMCTPYDLKSLTVGFLFSEGVINSVDEIISVSAIKNNSVAIKTENPGTAKRNLIITSSWSGARNIKEILSRTKASDRTLIISNQDLTKLTEQLKERQCIFQMTGAAHAAGIFNVKGEIIAVGEDVGRHNALDKAIGHALLAGKTISGCGVVLSGRVSVEMVIKAVSAGIEIIAAVSAPSSLAVELAKKSGITLCGFIREDKVNVYSCSERII